MPAEIEYDHLSHARNGRLRREHDVDQVVSLATPSPMKGDSYPRSPEAFPKMYIIAQTQDIQRKLPKPTLEIFFQRSELSRLPQGDREPITLIVEGVAWSGSICTTNNNRPYLHQPIHASSGKSSTTKLLVGLGVGDRAELRFEVVERAVLRLDRVVNRGHVREAGSAPSALRQIQSVPEVAPRAINSTSAFPFEDRDAILRLADRYWHLISAADAAEERAFEEEIPPLRTQGELSKGIFVRLARWKSKRKTPDYESNSEAEVRGATRRAFAANSDEEAIRSLTILRGVATRTASALLHWMVPDRYPILDFRVVQALGESEPTDWESTEYYARIADRIRDLANHGRVDLRTIDRALWSWNKLGGGD